MNEYSGYRILIVEDERDILKLIEEILRKEGFYNIFAAESCKEALNIIKTNTPSLCILDVMLPDGDGFRLFERLREYTSAPVIFLTARGEASDRIRGLGLGADDYMVKPFLGAEFVLRINAVLRRTYGKNENKPYLKLSDRYVDFETAAVVLKNGEKSLTAKEYILLKKLCENRNKIVTNDALCMALWGDGYYGYENNLMVHIRHLREKIEKDPSSPIHLITVKGLGYKLITGDKNE